MVCCVVITRRAFIFLFYYRFLAVPHPRQDFESAPLISCRRRFSRNMVAAEEVIGVKMEQQNIQCLVSPYGWYWLGRMLSKAEAVSMLVSKYGNPPMSISTEDAERLIAAKTVAATPLQKEQSMFTEAGLCFNFIDDYLDVKTLPDEAVADLERIKEHRSEGYVFLKRKFGLPIVQEANGIGS